MKLHIKEAQLMKQADSVQVYDGNLTVTFRGEYAKQLWEEYEKQLRERAGSFNLHVQLDIELQEPLGTIVP